MGQFKLMSPRKINRRDLSRLYGLDAVPDYIYESIMRADMDKATELEMIILDEYMAGKRDEIRSKKKSLGVEGGGARHRIGRAAENVLNVTYNLEKYREDDDHE